MTTPVTRQTATSAGRAKTATAIPQPAERRLDPSHGGSIAVRTFAAAGVGALLLALHVTSLALVLIVVIATLAFDGRHIFTLKNFMLVYTLLVFGVGGGVLHLSKPFIFVDVALYLVAFLWGYALISRTTPSGRRHHDELRRPPGKGPLSPSALEHVLLLLAVLNLMYLALQFLKFGVVGYYKGQGLLEQAVTYGKASSTAGAQQIVRFGLSYSAIALAILYFRACLESSTPIRYRYPATLLIALPLISLDRSNAIIGALTLLAMNACHHRLVARHAVVVPREAEHGEPPPPLPRPKSSRAVLILLGMVMAITVAVFIANLRGGLVAGSTGSPQNRGALFTSELSPVQAYGDIKANIGVLGHPYGKTIVLPLLLKVVPRAWFPNKPLNSGAYYMSTVRPAEWNAGFGLPPTLFGDAYLSFGFGGALALCLILGVMAARLDRAYKGSLLNRMPQFLLVFANFYALLRDPLSESLAGLLLTLAVYAFANRVLRPTAVVPRGERPAIVDPAR